MSNISFDKIMDSVFDGFKKITPALVAIAIMTGLIIFLPSSCLSKLGLDNLPNNVISIIGFLFLLSCTLILTISGYSFMGNFLKKIKHKRLLNSLKNKYMQLSSAQKSIIIKLLQSPSKSIQLSALSGDTIYLLNNNFLYRPQQILDTEDVYENRYIYTSHPWLIDLFKKEPQLFEMS